MIENFTDLAANFFLENKIGLKICKIFKPRTRGFFQKFKHASYPPLFFIKQEEDKRKVQENKFLPSVISL